jgi:hypothetical protein
MRKFIITAVLVLTCLFSKAQTTIQSKFLDVGTWNEYTQTWDWEKRKYCDVGFFLQGNTIVANDYAKSSYYTYETINDTPPSFSWKALDEKRKECRIIMKFFEGYSYFIVMYDNFCYRYVY